MSEKVNQYVKFIQNEQKRLNASTITAPRQLQEVQGVRGGGGAAGPGPAGGRVSGGMGGVKPHFKIKDGKMVPAERTQPKQSLELVPKEPTVSPSPKMAPRAEFKTEPLQTKTAVAGAAGAVGGAAAIKAGMDTAKEVEAERAAEKPAPAPAPAAKPAEKAEPAKPEQAQPAAQQADDEESGKYLSDIERRAQRMKKEAVERLFNIKRPRV